jgi:Putative peptidoglycan binding domain
MKLILVFTSCLVFGVGFLHAEPAKEGKAKRKGGAGGGQGQAVQHSGGQGGKRAHANLQGGNSAARLNANRAGAGGGGGQGKAARHAQIHQSNGRQRNVAAGQGNGGGGRKAQVRQFNITHNNTTNIKSVTFKANRRIVGAQNWSGSRYVAFRNYRPIWHDRVWWGAHYPRVVLIGGGWYYWNSGFWYPAWGYDPGASSYAYDGPIYAYNDLPPDQVVANVQQELADQGYYQGDIDGMLGPLTRAALAEYQQDHGLYTTSAIDEPTMSSLGFS